MPTYTYSVGTTQQAITVQDDRRTVLVINNIHATQTLTITDNLGSTSGIVIAAGGSLTLRKLFGEEPNKVYYATGSAAATTCRTLELYGDIPVEREIISLPNPQTPHETKVL